MKTRCPGCHTHYEIDAEDLLGANGMAHCLHCGTVFDAVSQKPFSVRSIAERSPRLLPLEKSSEDGAHSTQVRELPFDVPTDLKPLEASPEDAIDVADTLYEKRSYKGFFYGLIALLLITAFAAQLAWQYRQELLQRFPQLELVCQHIDCQPKSVHAPDLYRVTKRDIKPTENETGSLTLHAAIRNEAALGQHLPDIQLSLIDDNGGVLVRRRLAPHEYLYPPPADDRLIAPGEVFTIDIDFDDPGDTATGFAIDFY